MTVEDATAMPRSPVSVAVVMRGHTLVQDKPQASGGKDEGPMSSELFLAGLLACQHSTFVKIAAKRKAEVGVSRVKGELHFDQAGDIAAIKVHFDLAADAQTSASAMETLLRLTDKACTISRVLKVPITTTHSRVAAATPARA